MIFIALKGRVNILNFTIYNLMYLFNYQLFFVLYSTAWEDILRDNLLNFASSAKGLLLLQQTGAMNECMSYMYARYEKKLQVLMNFNECSFDYLFSCIHYFKSILIHFYKVLYISLWKCGCRYLILIELVKL